MNKILSKNFVVDIVCEIKEGRVGGKDWLVIKDFFLFGLLQNVLIK